MGVYKATIAQLGDSSLLNMGCRKKFFLSFPIFFHAGPAERLKQHPRKNFLLFNPIELKFGTMIEIFIPNNRMIFVFLNLKVFGGKMASQC